MTKIKGFTSQVVHHDRRLAFADGPVHAPIYNSVPFAYETTEGLMAVFQGKQAGHSYARQSTPTTDALQLLVTRAEKANGTIVFATGMAGLSAIFFALLKQGDHLITSKYLFGNTFSLMTTLTQFGISVSFVDPSDLDEIEATRTEHTRMVFVESLANPGTQIPALAPIGDWAKAHGIVYVVDNTITSPYLFNPIDVGASLIMNSLSKYFCGHGSVLGGAVTDTGLFDWAQYPHIFEAYRKGDASKWALTQIKKKALRDMGATLSSDAASLISMGAETLALRMDRACSNAMALANMLDAHEKVAKVNYPGLSSHPQHATAKAHFKHYGAILSFDLAPDYDCPAFLNSIDLVINATHLGDNRTLALPMASTIFYEMGADNRKAYGIGDNLIRCSLGIEDVDDIVNSFKNALDAL